jgi:manganese/iron transport system permease protein/iron/zinc/copper transport system permease protein
LLFGNVLGVTLQDVLLVAAVAVASAVIVFVRYRPLLFSTFDPEVAEVSGVSTAWIDLLLALMLASTITVTMSVVGVMLIAAMLVIPPVIARFLTDSFHRMLWISVVTGAVCGFVGVYLSFYLDWPSGATVVLTAAALFVVAYLVSGLRNRRALPDVGFDVH